MHNYIQILLHMNGIYGLSHLRLSVNNRSAAVIDLNTTYILTIQLIRASINECLTYKWHHDLHVHRKYMSRPFHKDNTTWFCYFLTFWWRKRKVKYKNPADVTIVTTMKTDYCISRLDPSSTLHRFVVIFLAFIVMLWPICNNGEMSFLILLMGKLFV